MRMQLCEGKLKAKIAQFRLPSASQKRDYLSSLVKSVVSNYRKEAMNQQYRTSDNKIEMYLLCKVVAMVVLVIVCG